MRAFWFLLAAGLIVTAVVIMKPNLPTKLYVYITGVEMPVCNFTIPLKDGNVTVSGEMYRMDDIVADFWTSTTEVGEGWYLIGGTVNCLQVEIVCPDPCLETMDGISEEVDLEGLIGCFSNKEFDRMTIEEQEEAEHLELFMYLLSPAYAFKIKVICFSALFFVLLAMVTSAAIRMRILTRLYIYYKGIEKPVSKFTTPVKVNGQMYRMDECVIDIWTTTNGVEEEWYLIDETENCFQVIIDCPEPRLGTGVMNFLRAYSGRIFAIAVPRPFEFYGKKTTHGLAVV